MNYRNLTILSMMVLAVITRLLPHPPNVAPITAAISLIVKSKVCNSVLARDRYFYPLQRAPPIFC